MKWARPFWTAVFLIISFLSFLHGEVSPGCFAIGFAVLCLLMMREDSIDDETR